MKHAHQKRLLGVAGLTLASGWIGVGLNRILRQRNSMESPGTLAWITAPLAATFVERMTRPNAAPSGWSSRVSQEWPWYAVGAATFPAVTVGALRYGEFRGWVDASRLDKHALATKSLTLLAPAMLKNVFEEAVWRGYFTSELQQRRISDGALSLSVGLIWGLWHAPYYLFFLPEEEIRRVLDVSRPRFTATAVATIVAWTVPYTELYRLSGSIWPCVVMHAFEDAFVNTLVLDGHLEIASDRKYLVSPTVGINPSAIYVAVGLTMRRFRLRSARRQGTTPAMETGVVP